MKSIKCKLSLKNTIYIIILSLITIVILGAIGTHYIVNASNNSNNNNDPVNLVLPNANQFTDIKNDGEQLLQNPSVHTFDQFKTTLVTNIEDSSEMRMILYVTIGVLIIIYIFIRHIRRAYLYDY